MVDINMLEGGLLMPPVSEAGHLVSFNAPIPLDISTLKVTITPVQSGTGDPSPTNIRPITGWTGANVYVSPTTDIADATTYPISWSDSAGTVYGGYVDAVSGKLTVTWRGTTVGALTWTMTSNYFYAPISEKANGNFNLLSSAYKTTTTTSASAMNDGEIKGQSANVNVFVKDLRYNSADTFKSGMADAQIVYELATPAEYDLTPTQVQTLIGQNNIWADCGDITLKTSPVFGKIKIRLMEEGISINGTSPLLRSASDPAPDTEEDTKTVKEPIEDIVKEPVDEKDTVKELPEDETEPEPEDEEVTEDDNERTDL